MTPTLPVHIKNLGAEDSTIGLVNGLFSIATLFVRPVVGVGLDRWGRKWIFLSGLLIFIAVTFSYTWLSTVSLILIFRFFHGIGWGATNTSINTIASDIIPKKRFGEGMGFFMLATNLAMAVSPSVGLFIIARYNFKIVSWLAGGLALLGLLLSLAFKYRQVEKQDKSVKRAALFEKTAIRPSAIMFFVTITYGVVNSFLALYAKEQGIENVGIYFTVMAIATVISRPVSGKIVDRFGHKYAVIPGMLLIISAMLVLAWTLSLSMFLFSGILYGLGFGAVHTGLQSLAVSQAPQERLGAANSTFFFAFDGGIGAGSIILGAVASALGYSKMYLVSSVSVIFALALFLFLNRKVKAQA